MPTIELTTVEADLLKEVLESDLRDLRMEIAGTDLKDLRDKLKEREATIRQLIERFTLKS
jgi:hypothetical protein